MKKYLWTALKARLLYIHANEGKPFNWLFLPGGPGLGSESLSQLTASLKLPGTIWHLDLPGDGSNTTSDDSHYFSRWADALIEAVSSLDNVILAAHSTGGMYALSIAELEGLLTGLVLMDSAPDASWQTIFMEYVSKHPIDYLEQLQTQYTKNPANDILKKMTVASAPYLFTSAGLEKGISALKHLPFNYKTCEWSAQHFDLDYKAQWIPQTIPTLIFAGDSDRITPLKLFTRLETFKRNNILIREISNAGHYPWIDNSDEIHLLFREYCSLL
ncbi:alpha/beta fold hydrolase [Legionella brunensis]|uniref:Hydrolases or acyltransferases (Alpha/beta hydrolase superfamily) n=1 Tax=Legionella brunensis TaxID=29422 RepID=A0A0W0SEM2_9GAMM|nr:alpha/beta hydrolase [Legionella brunensis]KTC81349.1 hydrolases or acyltransferases (alpha/beta hydrolase superfamily) [Legionella brunensis]